MIDPTPIILGGCNPAIAEILAKDIEAGSSDPNAYCGEQFCDYEATAVAGQINSLKGDALALEQLGVSPMLAKAIADTINNRKPA